MAVVVTRVVVAVVLAALVAAASAISYTVQVIAVSDQESALSISRDLLREGFPAYVVRSTGAQGDVFRVRVGAFANRGAALRYAESMPEVAGSRPVPALAEAIPQGIMPLAPRLLWHHTWGAEDVRVSPWPGGGIAVRLQEVEPLRQATYAVFQDGAERRFEAWAVVPLAVLPEPTEPVEFDVPIVDLTVPPPVDESAPDPTEPPDTTDPEDEGAPEPGASEEGAHEGDEPQPAETAADIVPADASIADWVADPAQYDPEAGLLLLRDRWLWPPSWSDDGEDVRTAFRASLVAITSRALGMADDDIDALAYEPAGAPPPALVVLDLSDPSARDAGWVIGIGDPSAGIGTHGPRSLVEAPLIAMPSWPATRLQRDMAADGDAIGGNAWTVTADGGFVRITLTDGATWRAGVGTPLWSDGTFVVAWDGELLLLYDFVAR